MKKILAIFLSVAMLFSLTACSKDTNTSSATATSAPTEIPLTTTVSINEDGNVECNVVQTYGYNDLLFTFDGDTLTKVESVIKVTGDDKLYQQVQKELEMDEAQVYFETLEFDDANQTVNCIYSEDGITLCNFSGKTPDELKTFLEDYADSTTVGISSTQTNGIVASPTPAV